ncbi:MAG TPA: GAF domain-containing SpoIIE family protein phosphatase [Candidatus Acidoferrales bacterium]|nr:GAF domain-containing SpoIIE family protein phosphatase [Candidatus Acidoferrales bacterium]
MTDRPTPSTASPPAGSRLPAGLSAEMLEQSLQAVPTIDLRDIGARLMAPLVHATGATRASLMLVNPDTGKLRIVAGMGLAPELIGKDIEWRPNSIAEWVFRKRQGLVLNGAIKREGLVGTAEGQIESAMSVPLEGDQGPIGVLNLACTGGATAFRDEEMIEVCALLPPVAAAIERALYANLCSRYSDQVEVVRGLAGRTLLAPGRHEARNFEIGLARRSSVREGGVLCERVPLTNGGHVLLAMEPRSEGVDALLTSAFTQGVFSACAAGERSAAGLMARLNAELCVRLSGRGEMAAWIGQFEPNGQLTSCAAGCSPPLWLPGDDAPATSLPGGGPMLGADPGAHWDEEQVRLLRGDRVTVVSTGVLGARNVMGQPFGPARLTEYLNELRHRSLDTATLEIVDAVTAWSGRPVPIDDLSVLIVRFSPGS